MINIKKCFLFLLIPVLSLATSCSTQGIDIETLDFDKGLELFAFDEKDPYLAKGGIFPSGEGYINYNLSGIKFGNVTFDKPDFSKFEDEDEELDENALIESLKKSRRSDNIAFIIDPKNPKKIIGYCLSLHSIEEGERVAAYIENKYGKGEKLLSPQNIGNRELHDGVLVGKEAYLWTNTIDGKTLGLEKDYWSEGGEQALFTTLYLVLKYQPVEYELSTKKYTYTTLLKEMWGWTSLEEMD